jgi:hypothetical protein
MRRSIIFIDDWISLLTRKLFSTLDIYKYLRSEKFEQHFNKRYPLEEFSTSVRRLVRERERYGRLLKVDSDWVCTDGDDADLLYYFQCQTCGTIVVVDHSDRDCIDYDLMCPVCNSVENTSIFRYYIKNTMMWIHFMKRAEFNDSHPNSYVSGGAKDCKFQIPVRGRVAFFIYCKYKYLEKSIKNKVRRHA